MIIADFLSNLVTGISWLELNSYQQYAIIVASLGIVAMMIEKVFGLFALGLRDAKRGGL